MVQRFETWLFTGVTVFMLSTKGLLVTCADTRGLHHISTHTNLHLHV